MELLKKIKYNKLFKKINNINATDTCNLVKKNGYSAKINETENKISTDHDHNKHITTQGFAKDLTSESLACKCDIPEIIDFDNKLKR